MAQTKEEKAARLKAYNKAYYIANKEKIAAKQRKWYIDNKEKVRDLGRAYYKANIEYSKECRKEYRKANKEKLAASTKAYREANKEKIKAYREANKEKIRITYKKWAEANKEKIKAYSASVKRSEYYQKNKHNFQNYTAKRRSLKRKQIPVHLRDCPQEKKRLTQTYKLSNILTKATGVQHHVDHMWPLADGGPHWSGNLQVIPAKENMSKHASVCEETKATIIKSLYTFDTSSPI